ncbi:hypothetical protein HW555_002085 [Spodoptera exigua]|uniref:Uncharacterized protein n=1 Tax=Spodoptera exigua TaxID=7107 RepID=A0A835GNW2_SPOEX|nr:hypothetical protein HW555_002085 [Spodoptera exigua]
MQQRRGSYADAELSLRKMAAICLAWRPSKLHTVKGTKLVLHLASVSTGKAVRNFCKRTVQHTCARTCSLSRVSAEDSSVVNMNGQENVVLCAAACVLLCSLLKKKRRKKPRCWVRPLLQRRNEETNKFLEEIKIDPLSGFKNFTRISCQDFELLVNATSPFIAKQDTNYRKCVPVSIRLAITLRYLATGDSFASLMFLFKVSKELIARIVPETCKALISVLKENIKILFHHYDVKDLNNHYRGPENLKPVLDSIDEFEYGEGIGVVTYFPVPIIASYYPDAIT